MSDVLIKGSEIPRNCKECKKSYIISIPPFWQRYCDIVCDDVSHKTRERHPNCPLKELVRCGDCAYSDITDNVRFCMCEDGLGRCVADNEFCSEGVKK